MATTSKWKLTALQGLILATLILAAIGGTLGLISKGINDGTINLADLGPYAPLIVNVLNGAPLIVVFIWIYNVFLFLHQNRKAALQQTTEKYDINKLVLTITWFVGVLGPTAAALPQYRAEINVIVLIGTAFVSELKNIWSGNAPTPIETVSKTTQSDVQATPVQPSPPAPQPKNITYGAWQLDPDQQPNQMGNWYRRPVFIDGLLVRYDSLLSPTLPTS